MQVSTSDGRIKVLGHEGVEGLLLSTLVDPAPTQQLVFASNRGGLVRLDQVRCPMACVSSCMLHSLSVLVTC